METAIAILSGLVALFGAFLQLMLIFEGLTTLGSLLFPFLFNERHSWLSLWGGWHLVVFVLIYNFAHDTITAQLQMFQEVAFELEGLRILAIYLVLPLLVSFLISRLHLYIRER